MKIYIAATYDRRDEVAALTIDLNAKGYEMVSTWALDETPNRYFSRTIEEEQEANGAKALANLSDIDKADVFVLLSDDGPTRGGKHFETGYAAARKVIPIFVIGHSEIMQHSLPIVDVLPDTEALYVKLEEWNQ